MNEYFLITSKYMITFSGAQKLCQCKPPKLLCGVLLSTSAAQISRTEGARHDIALEATPIYVLQHLRIVVHVPYKKASIGHLVLALTMQHSIHPRVGIHSFILFFVLFFYNIIINTHTGRKEVTA
jgi:hypothetical protein